LLKTNNNLPSLFVYGRKGGTLGASKPASDSTTSSTPTTPSGSALPSIISDDSAGGALRAPLAIQIKQGRGGLGMDSSRKRQAEEQLQKQEQEVHRVFDEGFRGQKRDQFELEKRKRQLGAARAICMRLDSKTAESRSAPDQDDRQTSRTTKDGQRSNRFWWIDDSMPDEVLGTKMMGPGAEMSVDLERDQDKRTVEGRPFDYSDDEDGDLERNKAKRVRLDSLVSPEVDQTDLQEEEPPKWGERPHFAQLEVNIMDISNITEWRAMPHFTY
jgi:hypothetical protein